MGARASYLLIPMDLEQSNHLKAYGIAYFAVAHQIDMSWLLNYRGGSFMCPYNSVLEDECVVRGVSYEVIADMQATQILNEIAVVENNMNRRTPAREGVPDPPHQGTQNRRIFPEEQAAVGRRGNVGAHLR